MDENKEVLTPQAEESAQEAAAEATEAVAEAAEETAEEAAEAAEETAEAVDGEAEEAAPELNIVEDGSEATEITEEVPKKKGFPLQKTIIIALVIVALAAITALVITVFFNQGVTGEWSLNPNENAAATADEPQSTITYYFRFNNDKTVSLTLGSTTTYGTYELSKSDDGQNLMTLSLPNLSGDFYYETSGNLFAGRTLKLTYTSDDSTVLNLHSSKLQKHEFERKEEFKPKEELIGNWVYSDEMYGVTISFDIKKDGTLLYTEDSSYTNPYTKAEVYSVYTIEGIYDYDDSTITLTYYDIMDEQIVIAYEQKDGALYINGNAFTKDGVATVDSAK